MCLALNVEDPGPSPVPAANTRQTLHVLRTQPQRGRAVVLELAGHLCGYALLISFLSNELGGEVCAIDEIYVEPDVTGDFVQDCEVCCNQWRVRVSRDGGDRYVDVARGDGSE